MPKVQDYELLLKVRADLQQAIDSIGKGGKSLKKMGDDGAAAAKRVEQGFERINKTASALKGALIGAGVLAGFRAIIGAVTEQENALAKLDAKLKSTGGSAGVTKKELVELSEAMQQLTTYGDEAVQEMEGVLLSFKNIKGPVFKGAVTAVLDISAALGIDLVRASRQVGQALNNPVLGLTVLQTAGISFTDKQKDVVKALVATGKTVEAQKIILDQLTQSYGGSAAAAAQTFGGSLAQLKNAFGDLLEGDGGNLKDASSSIRELTSVLQSPDVKAGFAALVSGAITATAELAKLLAGAATLTKFFAEHFARSQGNFAIDDTTGIDQRLSAIKDRLKVLQDAAKQGRTFGLQFASDEDKIAQQQRKIAEGSTSIFHYTIQKEIGYLEADQKRLQGLVKTGKDLRDSAKLRDLPGAASKFVGEIFGPDSSGTAGVGAADPKAAAKAAAAAAKAAADLQAANAKLAASIDALRVQTLDPTQKVWDDYTKAVQAAAAAGADVIKKGGDVGAVQKQVADAVALAAQVREKALKALSDQEIASYEAVRKELRTPLEVRVESAVEEIDKLNAALDKGDITAQKYAEQLQRAFAKAGAYSSGAGNQFFGLVPGSVANDGGAISQTFSAQDAENKAYAEATAAREKIRDDELAKAKDNYDRQLQIQREFQAQQEISSAQHAATMKQINQARYFAELEETSAAFGQLAELAKQRYGAESKQYRILFALSKAFAIAKAAVSLAQNVASASAYGFPENIPFIVGAFAQGVEIASLLAQATYGGGSGSGGYEQGGWTGNGPVTQIAGVVHGKEGVLSAPEVQMIGGEAGFNQLRRAIRGYASGGYVSPLRNVPVPVGFQSPAAVPASVINAVARTGQGGGNSASGAQVNVKTVLVQNADQLAAEILNTPTGTKLVIQHVGDNPQAIRGKWGTGG